MMLCLWKLRLDILCCASWKYGSAGSFEQTLEFVYVAVRCVVWTVAGAIQASIDPYGRMKQVKDNVGWGLGPAS